MKAGKGHNKGVAILLLLLMLGVFSVKLLHSHTSTATDAAATCHFTTAAACDICDYDLTVNTEFYFAAFNQENPLFYKALFNTNCHWYVALYATKKTSRGPPAFIA